MSTWIFKAPLEARKKDAETYEDEFLKERSRTCSMTFSSMVEIYMDDMRPRLRETATRSPARVAGSIGEKKVQEMHF